MTVALPRPEPVSALESMVDEAARQFTVCNACRYCEDYCAVFPAMELRSAFTAGDVSYLANVCHDCRACYQACMYTDPHPFALDLPSLLTEARVGSYEHFARPRALARLIGMGPKGMLGVSAAALVLVLLLTTAAGEASALLGAHTGPGAFYRVLPHVSMAAAALAITGVVCAAACSALVAFWRESGGRPRDLLDLRLWTAAVRDALTMRWMRGGGGECYYPDAAAPSPTRRRLHQAVVYGFLATFASTVSAFVWEAAFARLPPYGWFTLPVELGLWGGVAVTVGATGLIVLKGRNARRLTTDRAVEMDYTFLVALDLVAMTGILLLIARSTPAMGTLLAIHLALVFGLFVCAPYGKFVHAVYRTGALLRSVQERSARASR